MTPGADPVQTWNPSAGEYTEQKDGFAVFATRSPGTLTILGSLPMPEKAEELALSQVKNSQRACSSGERLPNPVALAVSSL